MALEVGIVGLPSSGKTTLFRALTRAETHGSGKEHVGMAQIPDDRLDANQPRAERARSDQERRGALNAFGRQIRDTSGPRQRRALRIMPASTRSVIHGCPPADASSDACVIP